jgi:hypothetical protein
MRTGNTGFSFAKRVSTNPTYEMHAYSLILPVPLLSCKQNGTNKSLSRRLFSERMSQVASTLVVNILAASAGVLVSLRSATARQAQQMLTVGGLVAMFGITFGLLELTSSLLPSLGIVLGLAQLLVLLLGLLTGIDIIVLTLALVRFQRSRLILIGK